MTALGSYLGQGDESALKTVYANDPETAFRAEGLSQDRQGQQRQAVARMFEYMEKLPPEQKAQGYAAIVPQLQRALPGQPIPAQYGPEVEDALAQIRTLAAGGGQAQGANVQSTYIDDQGQRVAIMRDGSTQILGGNDQGMANQTISVEGPDGRTRQMTFNKRTGTYQLAGGGEQAPARQYQPPPQALVATDAQGQPDDEFANLPAAVRVRVAELEQQGLPFHIANGRLVEGESAGLRQPVATPAVQRPTPSIYDVGGGGGSGQFTSRSPEDEAAAVERAKIEAQQAASAEQTRIEADRAAKVEAAKTSATLGAERQESQRGMDRAYTLYDTARQGLESALSGTPTNPLSGRLPAVTAAAQTAEGSIAAMAPVLKQLFRQAGEGVFTDKDQALLMQMLPTREDHPEARRAKLANIDAIVRSKLGIADDQQASQPPVEGARRAPDGFWYVQQNGQTFKVEP